MRFPENGLSSVVVVGTTRSDGSFSPKGTGFLAQVIRPDVGPVHYLVTAHHVIRDLPDPSKVSIRVNDSSVKVQELTSNGVFRWWRHPEDRNVDAAVFPWSLSPKEFPFVCFPGNRFLTPEIMNNKMIGVGDEIHMVGLFRHWSGRRQLIPMVRTGHLAMVASERMSLKGKYPRPFMHLVEAFSLAGFSGSPVFVNETVAIPLRREHQDDARWL